MPVSRNAGRREGRQVRFFSVVFFTLPFLLFSPAVAVSLTSAEQAPDLLRQASVLFEEGNTDQAIGKIRDSIRQDPASAEAYDKLGEMLIAKGRFDEALESFHAALNIMPSLRTARTGLGFALLAKGETDTAEAALKYALKLNPYPSMTHYALGLVYEKKGEYEKAVAQYKEAVKTCKRGKK